MERRAVIAAGLDAAGLEIAHEVVGAFVGDHIEVPRRLSLGKLARQADVLPKARGRVHGRGGPPAVAPAVERREEHAEDRGLKLVEAGVPADVLEALLVTR